MNTVKMPEYECLVKIKLLFLIFFIGVTSNAENSSLNGGLLWKISGNGLEKPSYIFGTHHLVHYRFLDSVPRFFECYNSVEQVVGEIQMDSVNLQKSISDYFALNQMKMPRDTMYRKLFSAKELHVVDSVFQKYIGCKSDKVYARPEFMMNIIFLKLMAAQFGISTKQYNELLDPYLTNSQAKLRGMVQLSLETVGDQIKLLFGGRMNLREGAKALIRFIEYDMPRISPTSQLKVLQLYRQQDIDLIASTNMDYSANKYQSVIDKFGKDRNIKWMEKLPAIIQRKSTMIVVGVFHLCYEHGLINQFRKLGYTVESVK